MSKAIATFQCLSRLALTGLCAYAIASMLGCNGERTQSMLHPNSSAAAGIASLWWLLCGVCVAVFVAVLLLLAAALSKPRTASAQSSPLGNRFILISGVLIPAIILIGLLWASLKGQAALTQPKTNLTIEVIGHQWWWEVRYPDQRIVIANELYIPVGEPVRLEVSSADVIHSFWAPALNGKTDMLPDKVNSMWIAADKPGVFRGQCAEFCGLQHAWMAFHVIALPRDQFDAWISDRTAPRPSSQAAVQQQGQEVFERVACNNCHSASGDYTARLRGPDLTHIGARRTLGAGAIPNTRANLKQWLLDSQHIKPGNLMPRTVLTTEDLHTLVDYLESLQ